MLQSSRPTTLLHIDSSVLADHSVSRRLSAALVEQWRDADPTVTVMYRDLGAEPPAHLSGDWSSISSASPISRSSERTASRWGRSRASEP